MDKPVIACLGNCQSGAIRSVLKSLPGVREDFEVVFTRKPAEFAALRPRLKAVVQQVTHGWDGFTLSKDDLPAGVSLIRYPAALLIQPWPLMPPKAPTADRSPAVAMFPYTICDSLVAELVARGVPKASLLDAYFSVDVTKRFPLDRLRAINEAKSRQIDAMADFAITDQMQIGQAMRTANHPNGPLFSYMLRHVIERLPLSPAGQAQAQKRVPSYAAGVGIQHIEAPVHPQVADHFDMTWAKGRKWAFWLEGDFTFEEHLLRLYEHCRPGEASPGSVETGAGSPVQVVDQRLPAPG